EYQRTTVWERLKYLGSDRLVAVGPVRVEVRMDKITAPFFGEVRGATEQVAAAPGNLDQFDAQPPQLFVLGPSDVLRHHTGHLEAERLRALGRTQGGVPHRRHDQMSC